MGKNRMIEQNRFYHLVSRLAHRAFFLDDEEKDRAVALMRRIEAGVQAIMSYCINRAVSISSDPFDPPFTARHSFWLLFFLCNRYSAENRQKDVAFFFVVFGRASPEFEKWVNSRMGSESKKRRILWYNCTIVFY